MRVTRNLRSPHQEKCHFAHFGIIRLLSPDKSRTRNNFSIELERLTRQILSKRSVMNEWRTEEFVSMQLSAPQRRFQSLSQKLPKPQNLHSETENFKRKFPLTLRETRRQTFWDQNYLIQKSRFVCDTKPRDSINFIVGSPMRKPTVNSSNSELFRRLASIHLFMISFRFDINENSKSSTRFLLSRASWTVQKENWVIQ